MRTATTSLLILVALATCGCKQTGFLAKRESEKCCPTDIRKTVPWCAGEDAIFHGPCEPSANFYGYKPTCWGIWPTSGAAWRDSHCGNLHHEAVITDLKNQNRELISLPTLEPLLVAPEPPVLHEALSISPEAAPIETVPVETVPVEAIPEVAGPPEAEPQSEKQPQQEPQEDLPKPTLGPIRLPAIDFE